MKSMEVILTAKTVEEAMDQAKATYGASDKELSFEILEMPKKGFLGIGAAPAKIKVTVTDAEEVNLSDLVSELKSLKMTTDRGDDRPAKNRDRGENREQQKKPQQNQKNAQGRDRQNQNPQKSRPQEQRRPEERAERIERNEKKADVRAAAAEKIEKKFEAKAAEAERAVRAEKAEKTVDESDLPAALRRPTPKNPDQRGKNQKNQKKPQMQKPRDDRDGETKKKDLLSAVMGISDPGAGKVEAAVTVTPTVMKPKSAPAEPTPEAPVAPVAPAAPEAPVAPAAPEAPVAPITESEDTSLADAVGAALAAFEAEAPAPLENEKDPREETRVEYITPEEMELALSFVNTLLSNMKLDAKAVAGDLREGEEAPEGRVVARVEIVGEDTGILIGHHGETLDAIQYLMNLSTSRRSGSGKREFVKILLDMGSYREKREETLRALARRTAARVVKYKRNFALEPMNPYERRIIHSEVHGIPDVSTHSVGSDENRKIVITYEGADKPQRDRRRGDRGDKRDRRRGEKKGERGEKSAERTEKTERPARPPRDRGERTKPVRAKSIDEIQIDLSGDSDKTFGSIMLDEGVETDADPIEEIVRETEAGEESLREY